MDNRKAFFEEKNVGSITFEKAYDISALPRGYYAARIKVGEKSYDYYFDID